MKVSFASSILLAAGLVAAVSARAEAQSMTLGATPAASSTSGSENLPDLNNSPNTFGTRAPYSRFAWGGLGIYHVGIDCDGCGGSTYFGLHAGAAFDIVKLAPDLPLSLFGNVALAFGGDVFFPITAGALVHYDKLPVALYGGLGLTIMPHSGFGDTPIGVAIYTMASYPLPQVYPGLSAMGSVQFHIMDDSFTLFVFNVGGMIGF
jgi:hypothetical protein